MHVYEYAVVRVVPRVEREEFLNVGIILFCAGQNFLQARFFLDKEKLSSLDPDLDLEEIAQRLQAIECICAGKEGGPIGELPAAGRFRWLTANRSTVVQTSATHPGLCEDAGQTLERLFEALVL